MRKSLISGATFSRRNLDSFKSSKLDIVFFSWKSQYGWLLYRLALIIHRLVRAPFYFSGQSIYPMHLVFIPSRSLAATFRFRSRETRALTDESFAFVPPNFVFFLFPFSFVFRCKSRRESSFWKYTICN